MELTKDEWAAVAANEMAGRALYSAPVSGGVGVISTPREALEKQYKATVRAMPSVTTRVAVPTTPVEVPAGTGVGAGAGVVGFDGIATNGAGAVVQKAAAQGAIISNGLAQPAISTPVEVPQAIPTALPLVGGALSLLGRFLTLGYIKELLMKYGPTIVKAIIGAGAFATVMKLLGIGAGDDTPVRIGVGRKARRVSVSVNSRPRTIHRAAKIAVNAMKKHDKYFKLLQPKTRTKVVAATSQVLSPVEKKALAKL